MEASNGIGVDRSDRLDVGSFLFLSGRGSLRHVGYATRAVGGTFSGARRRQFLRVSVLCGLAWFGWMVFSELGDTTIRVL